MADDDARLRSEEARAEYAALRAELDRRSTTQHALVVLQLTAVFAVVATATRGGQPKSVPLLGESAPFYLVALIPLFSFALAYVWMDQHSWIRRIGEYIRINIEYDHNIGWQKHLKREQLEPSLRERAGRFAYVSAHMFIFVGPPMFALVGLVSTADGRSKWTAVVAGAVLTAANLVQWPMRVGVLRSQRLRDPPPP